MKINCDLHFIIQEQSQFRLQSELFFGKNAKQIHEVLNDVRTLRSCTGLHDNLFHNIQQCTQNWVTSKHIQYTYIRSCRVKQTFLMFISFRTDTMKQSFFSNNNLIQCISNTSNFTQVIFKLNILWSLDNHTSVLKQ